VLLWILPSALLFFGILIVMVRGPEWPFGNGASKTPGGMLMPEIRNNHLGSAKRVLFDAPVRYTAFSADFDNKEPG
jgi:hypothetical protein